MNEFFQKLNDYFQENPVIFYILIGIIAALVIVIILWIAIAVSRSKKKKSAENSIKAEESKNTAAEKRPVSAAAKTEAVSARPADNVTEKQNSAFQKMPATEDTPSQSFAPEPIASNEDDNSADNVPLTANETAKIAEEVPEPEQGVRSVPENSSETVTEPVTENSMPQQEKSAAEKHSDKSENIGTASKSAAKKSVPTDDEDKRSAYNGKWVIVQDGTNGYYFELRASNGEKLLSSINYTSVAGAKNGIKTHKNNILKDNIVISQNKKGQYFFKLLNGSKQLLCTGETYPSKAGCESAVDSVKRFAESAVIVLQKTDEDKE